MQFKFVVDSNNWVINNQIAKKDDGRGNINNICTLPAVPGFKPQSVPIEHKIFPDIRLARSLFNQVHLDCTALNAEIFLH